MQKFIGNGVVLKCTTSTTISSSLATAVGGVLNVNGPDGDAADVDTTTLDSTSNDVTSQKGFGTAGDMTVTASYNASDAGWVKVKAMRSKTTIGHWIVTHPSTAFADETHKGYVKGVGRAVERDSMITRTITIHCSSGPGWN